MAGLLQEIDTGNPDMGHISPGETMPAYSPLNKTQTTTAPSGTTFTPGIQPITGSSRANDTMEAERGIKNSNNRFFQPKDKPVAEEIDTSQLAGNAGKINSGMTPDSSPIITHKTVNSDLQPLASRQQAVSGIGGRNNISGNDNRVAQIKKELIIGESNLKQRLENVEKIIGSMDGLAPSSSPEYRCISQQVNEINSVLTILEKQNEKLLHRAGQFTNVNCSAPIDGNCEVITCLECCDRKFSSNSSNNIYNTEFARTGCRERCFFSYTLCLMKKITEEEKDNIFNLRP